MSQNRYVIGRVGACGTRKGMKSKWSDARISGHAFESRNQKGLPPIPPVGTLSVCETPKSRFSARLLVVLNRS